MAHKPRRFDNLVRDALDFINQHSGGSIQGCFHKNNGHLVSFGVYNTHTKKYSIHYPTKFFQEDLLDIKRVVLERTT